MTMDVSKLGILVESQGIAEAGKSLTGLGTRAANAEKKIVSMEKAVKSLNQNMMNASNQAIGWNTALGGVSASMQQIVSSVMLTVKALNKVVNDVNRAGDAFVNMRMRVDASGNAVRRHYEHNTVMTSTLKAMTTAAIAYGAINLAKSVVTQADAWQLMEAKLLNATGSMQNAKIMQEELYKVAQATRAPLEEATRLYQRIAQPMARLGKDSKDTLGVVKGVGLALKVSGATAAESSSAMLQLSQSMQKGYLDGAEFNSIAEAAPILLDIFAKSLGTTRDKLKAMGSESKITLEKMASGILNTLPELEKKFSNLPVTFDDAIQLIKNSWQRSIGLMGQDTQFNAAIVNLLKVIEEMIPAIAKGIGSVIKDIMSFVEANKEMLKQSWQQATGLIADLVEIGKAILYITTQVVTLGGEFNTIGFALFSIRMFVAGIADGFTAIGAAILIAGGYLTKSLSLPMMGLAKSVSLVYEWYGSLLKLFAKGFEAFGVQEIADALNSAAKDSAEVTAKIAGLVDPLMEGGDALISKGEAALEYLSNGGSAVQKLFNETTGAVENTNRALGKFQEITGVVAANGLTKEQEKEAKKEANRHKSLMKDLTDRLQAQKELADSVAKYGLEYDKITEATKLRIKLESTYQNLLKAGVKGAALDNAKKEYDVAVATEYAEKANLAYIDTLKERKKLEDSFNDQANNAERELATLEAKTAAYGMGKEALESYQLSQLRLLQLQYLEMAGYEGVLAAINRQIAAQEKLVEVGKKYDAQEALKEFDKLMDASKAERFGEVLKESFGKAGKALGGMIDALGNYEKRQESAKKEQDALNKARAEGHDVTLRQKVLDTQQASSQIRSYAEMSASAKGFFKQNTKGYKMMEAAEKAFRLFELAIATKNFIEKSGMIGALTALFVTSKATETTAEVASVAPHVAAEGAKQGANATTALTSALAAPFPANLAAYATVAAMLAAIGVAISPSGGSDNSAKKLQEAAGTGTVLGDSSAKSESISKSIELLASNSDIALDYSSEMLSSLRNIESSISGVTTSVIKAGGLTASAADIESLGLKSAKNLGQSLLSFDLGSIFGTSQTLKDMGITADTQNLSDILSQGFEGKSYAKIKSTSTFLGMGYDSSTKYKYSELDQSLENDFTKIITNMVDVVSTAGEALGISSDQLQANLDAISISIGKISFKDLTGEQITEQLNAIFSSIGDTIVKQALSGAAVQEFQLAGEGLFETVVRLVSGIDSATYALEKFGIQAIDYTDIINKSGDVGAEIARQSIMLFEGNNGISQIISTLDGTVTDITSTYAELIAARTALQDIGLYTDLSRDLIRLAGGLDVLSDAANTYFENFYTEAEKYATSLAKFENSFKALGLTTIPRTNAEFRKLVEDLQASGVAGQELAIKLLLLSDEFVALSDQASAALATAQNDLSDAYDRESSALQEVIDKFDAFGKSLKSFRESLTAGDLSTLTNTQKYVQAAQKYSEVAAKAMAGDESAISSFESVAKSFLEVSRSYNASGAQYTQDFNQVLAATQALEQYTNSVATEAEKNLALLTSQVEHLITLNESVVSVHDAIVTLTELMAQGIIAGSLVNGTHASGLSYVPFDGYVAQLHEGESVLTAAETKAYQSGSSSNAEMVAELKALRAEVATLRSEQQAQTGALIQSNYDANDIAASKVASGYSEAVSKATYKERSTVGLV